MQTFTHDEVATLKAVATGNLNVLAELGVPEQGREKLEAVVHKLDNYFSLPGREISVDLNRRGDKAAVTVTHLPTRLKVTVEGTSELQCKAIALKQLEAKVYKLDKTG